MKIHSAVLTVILSASVSFGEISWDQSALSLLQQAEPQAAAKIAKSHSDTQLGQILLCAAYAQQYDQSKNAKDMAKATQAYKELLPLVTVKDAVILHSLRKMKGSILHSYSETLLDQALRRIETPEQAMAVPAALEVVYPSERCKVFSALSDWLAAQRVRILNGELIDDETRSVFTDERLIAALVDKVEVKKKSGKPAAQALSSPRPGAKPIVTPRATTANKLQPPRTNATARECLILIEEPAIPLVQAMLPQLGDDGISLLSELCTAKTVRENKAPGFMWIAPQGN
jgi:hypothetical protein